jgi:hypothetical protein
MSRVVIDKSSGCWLFTGAKNEAGYGIVGNGGRGAGNDRAHRITFRHHKGDIPEGIFVCHTCDTPACCNPDHLFLGTNKENHEDMVNKSRHIYPPYKPGQSNGNSKLTEEIAKYIKYSEKNAAELARELNIPYGTVSNVKRKRTWNHV